MNFKNISTLKNLFFDEKYKSNHKYRTFGGLRSTGFFKKSTEYKPLISIVTVVLNERKLLNLTMNSVLSLNYDNIEYIIIDGGSNDKTLDLIKKYDKYIDYWISEQDTGIYDAMNKGLKLVNGDFICFLNAGDVLIFPDILNDFNKINDILLYDVIYGDSYIIYPDNEKIFLKSLDFNFNNLIKHGTRTVCHQAFFIKKNKAPFYNLQYRLKAELNWYFDIIENNPGLKILYLNKPIVYYNHEGIGSKQYFRNKFEWIKLIINRYGLLPVIKNHYFLKIIYGFLRKSKLFRLFFDRLKFYFINKNNFIKK